ncbi:hypothetical protein Hanom_Chr05g00430581 [Helianthus anomalus]
MHYCLADEGFPKIPIVPYAGEQWYKMLVRNPTSMLQLDEISFAAYGLINALDPKIDGEMVGRIIPEGELLRDYFHHPIAESLSAILLSSEESTVSSDGLIHRSRATRAGPQVQPMRGAGASTTPNPVTLDPEVAAHESERPEAQSRLGVQTGKHPSHLRYLGCVVVSDTLSSLDICVKRTAAEVEEDQATITQIMEKKRKLLSDTKHKLNT